MNNFGDRIEKTTLHKKLQIFRLIESEKIKYNDTDGGVDVNLSDLPSDLTDEINLILDTEEIPELKMKDLSVTLPVSPVAPSIVTPSTNTLDSFLLVKEKIEYNLVQQRIRKKLKSLIPSTPKKNVDKDYGELLEEEENEETDEHDLEPDLEELSIDADEETADEGDENDEESEELTDDLDDMTEAMDELTVAEDAPLEFDFKETTLSARLGFYTRVLSKMQFAF